MNNDSKLNFTCEYNAPFYEQKRNINVIFIILLKFFSSDIFDFFFYWEILFYNKFCLFFILINFSILLCTQLQFTYKICVSCKFLYFYIVLCVYYSHIYNIKYIFYII